MQLQGKTQEKIHSAKNKKTKKCLTMFKKSICYVENTLEKIFGNFFVFSIKGKLMLIYTFKLQRVL